MEDVSGFVNQTKNVILQIISMPQNDVYTIIEHGTFCKSITDEYGSKNTL